MVVVKALLSRIWPHLLAVAALLFAIWYLDHQGYERARKDAAADAAKARAEWQADLRDSEHRMAGVINFNGHQLAGQIDKVRSYHSTVIQPTIEREIRNDPLLARGDARLSDGLWRALNAARSGSTCSAQPGERIECALPPAVDAGGPAGVDAGAPQP